MNSLSQQSFCLRCREVDHQKRDQLWPAAGAPDNNRHVGISHSSRDPDASACFSNQNIISTTQA